MQQSILNWINNELCDLIPGAEVYGIARTALKDERMMPYCPADDKYIGIDDTFPFQAYHKELSLSTANVPRSGFGDNISDLANTYGMALIIFFDEKKLGVKTDELYTLIQSRITGILKIEGYKQIRIGVTNAILNDGQVWAQEYGQTVFRLSASQRLIQIGYSVTLTLDKNCFPKCISKS